MSFPSSASGFSLSRKPPFYHSVSNVNLCWEELAFCCSEGHSDITLGLLCSFPPLVTELDSPDCPQTRGYLSDDTLRQTCLNLKRGGTAPLPEPVSRCTQAARDFRSVAVSPGRWALVRCCKKHCLEASWSPLWLCSS